MAALVDILLLLNLVWLACLAIGLSMAAYIFFKDGE